MTYDLYCHIQVQFPHRVYAVIHMPLCEAHIAYIHTKEFWGHKRFIHRLMTWHGFLPVWLVAD
jgi:hypothetical protein